jgi:hypothetical protein
MIQFFQLSDGCQIPRDERQLFKDFLLFNDEGPSAEGLHDGDSFAARRVLIVPQGEVRLIDFYGTSQKAKHDHSTSQGRFRSTGKDHFQFQGRRSPGRISILDLPGFRKPGRSLNVYLNKYRFIQNLLRSFSYSRRQLNRR